MRKDGEGLKGPDRKGEAKVDTEGEEGGLEGSVEAESEGLVIVIRSGEGAGSVATNDICSVRGCCSAILHVIAE